MLKGSIVALITPFLNGEVDYISLERLLDFHLSNKTDGLLLLGTTAESSTLSEDECRDIVSFCLKYINNRLDIIVGICTNNTAKSIKDCEYYEKIGVEKFLVITPYYNKSNEEGIYNHFSKIANSIEGDIIIYNIPSRTNINLSFNLIERLSKIANIIGVKDANENLKESIKLFSLTNFNVYCGNDEYMLFYMLLGAKGIINVSGNVIPKEISDIYNYCSINQYDKAVDLFNIYKGLILSLFSETNPIGIKTAMSLLSLSSDEFRLPLFKMSENNKLIVKKEIDNIGKYFNN